MGHYRIYTRTAGSHFWRIWQQRLVAIVNQSQNQRQRQRPTRPRLTVLKVNLTQMKKKKRRRLRAMVMKRQKRKRKRKRQTMMIVATKATMVAASAGRRADGQWPRPNIDG